MAVRSVATPFPRDLHAMLCICKDWQTSLVCSRHAAWHARQKIFFYPECWNVGITLWYMLKPAFFSHHWMVPRTHLLLTILSPLRTCNATDVSFWKDIFCFRMLIRFCRSWFGLQTLLSHFYHLHSFQHIWAISLFGKITSEGNEPKPHAKKEALPCAQTGNHACVTDFKMSLYWHVIQVQTKLHELSWCTC